MPPAHPARGMYDTHVPRDRRARDGPAAHPHVAGPDPPDGEAVRHGTLPIHAVMPGSASASTRPTPATSRSSTRSKGWWSTTASPSATWPGRSRPSPRPTSGRTSSPPAAGVLPLHRAVGRVRDHVHHLPGRGCRTCSHTGWIELGGLRHGRPGRLRRGGDRRGRVVGVRLRLRDRPPGADAPRHPRHASFMENDIRFLSQF